MPDKKIETFGFTRDDIKKIARESVYKDIDQVINDAIDSGAIDISDNVKSEVDEILAGDVTISGDLVVSGETTLNDDVAISGNVDVGGYIHGGEIIETMSGYSFIPQASDETFEIETTYAGVVKNGNKITFVIVGKFTRKGTMTPSQKSIGKFSIPASIYDKLYPVKNTWLTMETIYMASDYNLGASKTCICNKENPQLISPIIYGLNDLTLDTPYYYRYEATFLLSDNLISGE